MLVSVIVPVYNEEKRIQPFLKNLKKVNKKNWEIIFVNDGSTDNSLNILKNFKIPNKRVITYSKNRGKGYAVKNGVEAARGSAIVFIDADGSIHPSQIKLMVHHLLKKDFVVGSRASKRSQVTQPILRIITGKAFNALVNLLFWLNIKDSLCGFKGFKINVAKELFRDLMSDGWIFDVELFYKAKKKGIKVYNMPIKWEHREQSKITILAPFKMALNLVLLRLKLATN